MHTRLFHHTISGVQFEYYNPLELAKHREFQVFASLNLIVNKRHPHSQWESLTPVPLRISLSIRLEIICCIRIHPAGQPEKRMFIRN